MPMVERVPPSQKFLLGDRIPGRVLDLLEGLIEATYRRESGPILRRVNLLLVKFRMLVRLAKDLGYLDLRHYEQVARNKAGWWGDLRWSLAALGRVLA
jgi:hypothetical protein